MDTNFISLKTCYVSIVKIKTYYIYKMVEILSILKVILKLRCRIYIFHES